MCNKQVTNKVCPSEGVEMTLRTEVIDGEHLDTDIEITGQFVVSGKSKDEFVAKLGALIDEYRV